MVVVASMHANSPIILRVHRPLLPTQMYDFYPRHRGKRSEIKRQLDERDESDSMAGRLAMSMRWKNVDTEVVLRYCDLTSGRNQSKLWQFYERGVVGNGKGEIRSWSLSHRHGRRLVVMVAVSSSRSLSRRHGRCLVVTVVMNSRLTCGSLALSIQVWQLTSSSLVKLDS